VGHLGDGTDPDAIAVVGETPNIAARLQSIAEPGTVIISNPTYRLVEGFFHCRSLGAPALKGVAAPIELYSVLAESGIQSRFERAVASGLTRFVSRQAEVELLLQRLERARNGAGQVVLLSGEAGIGKSRLIRVLKERATGEPKQLAREGTVAIDAHAAPARLRHPAFAVSVTRNRSVEMTYLTAQGRAWVAESFH
jgi:hypothetical protein